MAEENKPNEDKPKIIVDDDWKAQAKAEKERLAKEVDHKADAATAKAGTAGQQAAEPTGPRQLPPASLATLVGSLAAQTMLALGAVAERQSGKRYVDMDLAKHHIDTLVVLEEKTKNNLTDEEKKLLDQALYEVRMQYVQVAQAMTAGGVMGPGPGEQEA